MININHWTSAFADNNPDTAACGLLRIVFSSPGLIAVARNITVNNRHSVISRPFGFLLVFPNLMSSVVNGAIFGCRLHTAAGLQSGSGVVTCSLNKNHVLL